MIVRLILVATLALLMGCNGFPGSLKPAAQDTDTSAPVAEALAATIAEEMQPADAMAEQPVPEPAAEIAQTKPVARDANAGLRATCVARGGNFTKTKAGAFICVNRTSDAAKHCTASNQCEGECLARSGTCSPVVPLIGCHDIFTSTGGMATVCID